MASRSSLAQLFCLLWLSWVVACTDARATVISLPGSGTFRTLPGSAQLLAGQVNKASAGVRIRPGKAGSEVAGKKGHGTKGAPTGPEVAGSTHSSATGKLTANLGEKGTLTAAPLSAFGFLPSKAAAGSVLPGSHVPKPVASLSLNPGGVQTSGFAPRAIPMKPSSAAAPFISPATATHPLPVTVSSSVAPAPASTKQPASVSAIVTAPATNPSSASTRSVAPAVSPAASSTVANSVAAASTTPATVSSASVARNDSPASNVVLDNSLGQTGTVGVATDGAGVNTYTIDQTAGFLAGANLFFSFSQFSLINGETANFNGPASVQNVLARVTGGMPSTIDGTINVNIPGASFFLMNPAGVIFTANAQVFVTGSFAVTTADYLKLSDGTRFNAMPGIADKSLTTAAVSAFGFLAGKPTQPAAVTFTGSSIATVDGTALMVVAGNQTIDGSTLFAPSGELALVSVAGPGEVPAVPTTLAATPLTALPALGTITITDFASLSAASDAAAPAGRVQIAAGVVNLLVGSTIDSSGNGIVGGQGDAVLLRSQTLFVSQSTISASPSGGGNGGKIDIQAQNVTLTSSASIPSSIETITFDQSVSGDISVAAGSLDIIGSTIETSTLNSGRAGNINVTAQELSISGLSGSQAAGIFAESGSTQQGGQSTTGRGGDVSVVAQQVTLTGGAQISSATFGPGQGGNVSITAGNLSISGSGSAQNIFTGTTSTFQSGVFASSDLPGDLGLGGQGGNIAITTGGLLMASGGEISTSTIGTGNGGNVTISASSVDLNGSSGTMATEIAATTSYPTGGKGGNITISAGSLQVIGGADISAATMGNGSGGNISVSGGSVLVSGSGSIITAQTTAAEGGAGGNLQFNVSSLSVLDAGEISASTTGSGRGGSIQISANEVTVEGGASIGADTSGKNTSVTLNPSVANLSLTLNIEASDDSGVSASLFNPSGANFIPLFSGGDASGANFTDTIFSDSGATTIAGGTASYTGTFQATVPLSLFNGAAANGNWQLQIVNASGSTITLDSWSISINGKQFASTGGPQQIVPLSFPAFTMDVAIPATVTLVKAGSGGSIQINANAINLGSGGTITASTHGDGAAGSLNVQANSIHIDGSHAASDTGLFASADAGSTGRGGSIFVSTAQLQITGSGSSSIDAGIVARSQTNAPAGDIDVQTDDLLLNSGGVVSSANLAAGPAGSVTIKAGDSITLQNGSLITVVAQGSDAGMITLSAGQNIELFDGSTVTAAAGLGGGSIMIKTGNEFELNDSSLVATAGAGAGGNITIDPEFIILNHGLISANAAAGAGGNILIEGQYFFDNESPITATGTTAGTVQITTLPLDIVNALADLQGGFIDLSTDLQESCTMRLDVDASSFLVIGRGDVADSPSDPQEELRALLRKKAHDKAHAR
ncbi:MAG TPA: filamentous hemagglutinin N-terminal domain-containing protein [Chthoniobacter sp.]